jgi:alkylmercury lyase
MQQAAPDINELADRLLGTVARFDSGSRLVAVKLYRLLADGSPVPLARLANALNLPGDTVSEILSRYATFSDGQGAIIGFGGLTVAEMLPHRFQVEGRTLYTWCAWDSLFIPGILGRPAEVTSRDPITRTPISMRVAPDGVTDVRPQDAVVSFLAPDRTFDRNVIANFCRFVHFFSAPETGRAWTAQHPGTFLLSIEDAFMLGQLTNARKFGDAFTTSAHGET